MEDLKDFIQTQWLFPIFKNLFIYPSFAFIDTMYYMMHLMKSQQIDDCVLRNLVPNNSAFCVYCVAPKSAKEAYNTFLKVGPGIGIPENNQSWCTWHMKSPKTWSSSHAFIANPLWDID